MQNAETVVDILRARGRRGLPCDELYRQLFNPALFLMAWGRIYANDGAMTPGPCGETADGMSRYTFTPLCRCDGSGDSGSVVAGWGVWPGRLSVSPCLPRAGSG